MESGWKNSLSRKNRLAWKRNETAKFKGDGLALSLPMPLLIRGVPKIIIIFLSDGRLTKRRNFRIY